MESLAGVSAGMTVRLAFALATAVVLGAWLYRMRTTQHCGRFDAALRAIVLALCAFWSATWLLLALLRLSSPYELEWCGGAMRDMAARALNGQSLYVAPGPAWFPYEYPPLYLWVSAALMRIAGGAVSFAPMRLVSIASTLGSAALLAWWVRRLSSSRTWGLIAAGLFLASYRFTGAWYDVERLDMLFLFLSLGGICLLQRAEEKDSIGWACAAAVAHLLAFLTKQQAILFIVAGMGALVWQRKWRSLAVYTSSAIALCIGSVGVMNAATGGWFSYYCFRVPMANGIRANLARTYVLTDLPLFAPALAILFAAGNGYRAKAPATDVSLLWWMTGAGVLGSLISRAHWGGDRNVLITGYVFLGAAACVPAGRWSAAYPGVRAPLFVLVLAQLLTLTYRPAAQLPRAQGRAAGDRYAALIRTLEKDGLVLSLDHGSFTTTQHFHLMALLDVMQTQKGLPSTLLEAVQTHRFAAIVVDAKPENEGYLGVIAREYRHVENMRITNTWVVTGFPTPSPARSVWVLRP